MADETDGQRWAAWLRNMLKGRPQQFLVERSRGDIKKDTVSRWMTGKSRPRPETAVVVAGIFNVDRSEALRAAGYEDLASPSYEQIREDQARAGMLDESIIFDIEEIIFNRNYSDSEKFQRVKMLLQDRVQAKDRVAEARTTPEE